MAIEHIHEIYDNIFVYFHHNFIIHSNSTVFTHIKYLLCNSFLKLNSFELLSLIVTITTKQMLEECFFAMATFTKLQK